MVFRILVTAILPYIAIGRSNLSTRQFGISDGTTENSLSLVERGTVTAVKNEHAFADNTSSAPLASLQPEPDIESQSSVEFMQKKSTGLFALVAFVGLTFACLLFIAKRYQSSLSEGLSESVELREGRTVESADGHFSEIMLEPIMRPEQ
jgi:hypothetical protein